MSYKTPIYDYRAKDGLDPDNPKKKVMGYELMAEFEAIAKEITEVEGELEDHWVEKAGDVMTGTLDTPKLVAVDILAAEINADEIHAVTFHGNGEEITDIITDQLKDVNSEGAVRDDLLIFNGTLWEATDFAFIETALTFNGGIDLTNSAEYPADQNDGDLYIANEDGVVAAEWVGIAGTSVVAGNFVGWAESKGRWYLLGDLASAAVTRVAAGLGIDVDDSVPAEPVVSIDRTEVDTWYADLTEFNDLQLEVEGNTAQIEINKDDIADNKLEIDANKIEIEANADNIKEITVNIGDISLGDLEANVEANLDAINTLDADAVKKSVTTKQEMVGDLKAKSFEGSGVNLSGITTDQLADVNSAGANKDEFLIYNGSSWVAEGFHIDTELTYQGAVNLTAAMSVPLNNGDLYVNNTAGVVHASWTGIGGKVAREGNFVGYATSKAQWFLLGDIASSSVTDVEGGAGIDVDDSKPAEPVVSIDRAEVDAWYEPKFSKLSAFNKNFGTTAGTVSEGNHSHSQYITSFTETDPTVPAHVKSISTADIAKWNTPAPAGGAVDSVNGKTGVVVLSHTDVGAAAASHTHAYAPTNHTHSEYAPASHTHPYAPTSHTHTEYAPVSHTHSNYLTTVAAGNGTKLTGTNKIEMSGSFTGNHSCSGKTSSATFGTTGQEAGKRFNVSANGHIEATSLTGPSNLAGTHGTCGYTFGQGFGDMPGNVKATSTIKTGKYRATWTAPGNFFAGQIVILGTGGISDFYAYSLNCVSAGFFEHADMNTFENNVKGKEISFMVGAMIPSNASVNPGRSAKEYEEYLEVYEAASKLEVCGGSHGTIYAEPNDLGLITIHTPYLSDHSAAIAGVKDMVKANRSELPASVLLHNGFRLDGKKIILDLDAARADVEEQFTNTLAALIVKSQNRALLTGDERSTSVCREIYRASVERIKKGNAAELTRMLTALSDMSAEFIPLRSL